MRYLGLQHPVFDSPVDDKVAHWQHKTDKQSKMPLRLPTQYHEKDGTQNPKSQKEQDGDHEHFYTPNGRRKIVKHPHGRACPWGCLAGGSACRLRRMAW